MLPRTALAIVEGRRLPQGPSRRARSRPAQQTARLSLVERNATEQLGDNSGPETTSMLERDGSGEHKPALTARVVMPRRRDAPREVVFMRRVVPPRPRH